MEEQNNGLNEQNNEMNQEVIETYETPYNETPNNNETFTGAGASTAPTYEFNPNAQPKKKQDSFGKKAGRLVASSLVFGILAGTTMIGMEYASHNWGLLASSAQTSHSNKEVKTTTTVTNTSSKTEVEEGSVAQIAQNSMPSIVAITSKVVTTEYDFFNQQYNRESEGSGSGIIIGKSDDELLVATNNHVVEGASELTVQFIDKKTVKATIKGTDADSDLAVISIDLKDIDSDTLDAIAVAVLGDSDDLQVGEQVVAIGNALGYGQSVTVGYISALDREVALEDKNMTLLQTDAAINAGNSGGALLNMKGQVIGINSAKYAGNGVEGMGYAIPISDATPIINSLMNPIPEEQQAFLGIMGSDITEEMQQRFNWPSGIYVSEVSEDSPAQKGGIEAGDIIVEFDGDKISSMSSLQSMLSRKQQGDKVKVVVKRQNARGSYSEETLTITLQAKGKAK